MAVTSTPTSSDFALVYDNAGKSVTRRYSEVKFAAADADVYSVASSLDGLQDQTLTAVQRRLDSELVNA
ncbi:MAG TPA: DUF1659 domain-containing protein [Syntrophomonadaceae bacterium]|nr:DUF1659 domain-containing protein [Syntrophomonadaceae bacterium]